MEIEIKIKLEDTDIELLIKSLFEVLKKVPQDNINIKIDPNTKPPQHDLTTNTGIDVTNYPTGTITTKTGVDIGVLIEENKDIYYSNNGESVKKIESEKKNEKKNEVV